MSHQKMSAPLRFTILLPNELATEMLEYKWKKRMNTSEAVRDLIDKGLEDERERKILHGEGLATEEELREAVASGIVTAEEVGLK